MATEHQSPLPFPEPELLAVRLLPAEFARAVGVSKQSVSRWIAAGKVTLGCDGRMNPNHAMRELLRNGDPGRIRARLIRLAVADLGELRTEAARADALTQELEEVRAELARVERAYDQDFSFLEAALDEFQSGISCIPPNLRATADNEAWLDLVANIRDESRAKAEETFLAPALPIEGGGA